MVTKEQECYIIIADEDVYKVKGSYPENLLIDLTKTCQKVTIISLYSNSVKFVRPSDEGKCWGDECTEVYKEVPFGLNYETQKLS